MMRKTWVFNLLIILMCSILLVNCSSDDEQPTDPDPDPGPVDPDPEDPESDAKAIVTFTFADFDPPIPGTINEPAKTVAVTVPQELTNITAMTPTIEVSEGATVSPASGVVQDFTNPVTYTVTAEDESTQQYVVTVTPVSVVECLPSKLPAFLGRMNVYYSDDPVSVDYAEFFSEFDPAENYTAFYRYTGSQLDWIEYYRYLDGIERKTQRTTFTYPSADVIVESIYQYNYQSSDDPPAVLVGRNRYYKTGDQITEMEKLNASDQVTLTMLYHYNAVGNITHQEYKLPGGSPVFSQSYEYDTAVNVYRLTGLTGSYWQYYMPENNMSRNNVTLIDVPQIGTEIFEYTYDENDIPLSRSREELPWEDYEYPCD
ncbi:DUF5018 domain-containing protein [Dawidia soli]|uniref:DUF5018 domain-containing protein n=1 Tax=Dawidia soli TaxID=2782352 RepID=A0AAP2GJD5_9BACT|nr:DUF5018 domain-containing protein [Dawidia soli]MBT1688370.1 DUF5018 domain-containing protein [Dawidia soli]